MIALNSNILFIINIFPYSPAHNEEFNKRLVLKGYAMCDLYKLSGQQAVQIERLTTLAEVEPNAYGMG